MGTESNKPFSFDTRRKRETPYSFSSARFDLHSAHQLLLDFRSKPNSLISAMSPVLLNSLVVKPLELLSYDLPGEVAEARVDDADAKRIEVGHDLMAENYSRDKA